MKEETEKLVKRLQAAPDIIYKQQLQIIEAENTVLKSKDELEVMKAGLILDIAVEMNEKGKPKYPNAEMRDAKMKIHLSEAPGTDIRQKLWDDEAKKKMKIFELEMFKNILRVDLATAELMKEVKNI